MDGEEIPQLEEEDEEEDHSSYHLSPHLITHHNTHQESECKHQEYSAQLQDLDDDQYYQEIDQPQDLQYSLPVAPYNQPARHSPPQNSHQASLRSMEELCQLFGRGRGKARCKELHSHHPFGARTRSLQSCIQRKIKKTQQLHQRYLDNC